MNWDTAMMPLKYLSTSKSIINGSIRENLLNTWIRPCKNFCSLVVFFFATIIVFGNLIKLEIRAAAWSNFLCEAIPW